MLNCSFCGKSQKEVMVLIAGPNINICNECVKLCAEMCFERGEENYVRAEEMTAQTARLEGKVTHLTAKCGGLKSVINRVKRGELKLKIK